MTETTKLTIQEMKAQLAALQAQIAEASAHETNEALDKIRILIAEHGLTAQQIFPNETSFSYKKLIDVNSGEVKEKKKAAPKFRNPAGGDDWSGRGVTPRWLKATGVPKEQWDQFLINKPAKTETLPLV